MSEKHKGKVRVADYIASFIAAQGVKDVFMLSGGGIMHLTDGLACNKDLKVYCLHHEQSVSMALEAYSRMTGNFGVGYFTTGPGATNALTGLAGAWVDSVPCLFISGQVKRCETVYKAGIPGLRQFGVQELNIVPVVESLTKYTAFIEKPEDIRFHLEKAFFTAKDGRPGPVWLDVPLDVQGALIDLRKLKGFKPTKRVKKISAAQMGKVLNLLSSAKRPVIMAGQGVRIAGAMGPLRDFVSRFRIPVITTYLGVDVIEDNNPYYIGRIGIKGDRAGNLAMQNSDLLIVLGSSLPVAEIGYDYSQFARDAKVVIVDIDPSSHKKKTIRFDVLVEGDIKDFLEMLSSVSGRNDGFDFDGSWMQRCASWKKRYPVCLHRYCRLKKGISTYYLMDRLSRKLRSGDAVVTDAGSTFYIGCQATRVKKGVRYITSGGLATMGYSLPASIGVCAAAGRRRVMCITGDGSFQQNIQELQSVMHYRLPLKIFVLNNQGYLSIRFTQSRYFEGRLIGEGPKSGVSFPDNKKIAKAYGMKFIRASDTSKLDKVIDKVLSSKGPVLCEVVTPPNQMVIPTVSSQKLDDGRMVSKPLEDMYPFLDRKIFRHDMVIRTLDD
ncbi:thiamine pyrophosphate-binding protein [Nanoarchaeota archaeon]